MGVLQSRRFGNLEVPDDKTIIMERPILGFEHLTSFCLVDLPELSPFLWLQSTEEADIAFLVVNPVLLFPDYRIEVNSKEIAELRVAKVESVETYVIVTLPERPEDISVNLQGPILINTENNLAKQLVLVNSRYEVRHYLRDMPSQPAKKTRRRELVSA